MTRLHVVGAAGYAGSEVVRLARTHPNLQLGVLESASHAGARVGDHVPALRKLARTFDGRGSVLAAIVPGDVVVVAGDAAFAREYAAQFLERGARVVDLSDAFRLSASAHHAVYGFTERYRDALPGARIVANPGCYPTASLLALWPLAAHASGAAQVIVDAKSGITGAGRTPSTSSLFAEVDGDVRAYGLEGHRHHAEIAQELGAFGLSAPLLFTPHVVPLGRGLLVDAYLVLTEEPDPTSVRAAFERTYAGSRFVRVLPEGQAPSLRAVERSNDTELHVSTHGRTVRVLCAIDNLGKGSAGQAIQNLNVMLGLPEHTALDDRSIAA